VIAVNFTKRGAHPRIPMQELTASSAVSGSHWELAGRRNTLSINSGIQRSHMQNLSTLSAGHSGTFILKRNLKRQSFIS